MKKLILLFSLASLIVFSIFLVYNSSMSVAAAQAVTELSNPLTKSGNSLTVTDVTARIIKLSLGIISFISLLMFMYGGFKYMISDNAKALGESLKIMATAVAGVAVAFLAYSIITTVFKVIIF